MIQTIRTSYLVALTATGLLLAGCDARQMGVHTSATQAKSVDATWATAARSCWPMMADKSDTYMKYNLAEPAVFRNTFPGYASLGDTQIFKVLAQPVNEAPEPATSLFQGSTYPLLTRQAVLSNQASTTDAPTPATNAFCAKHPGTPAEYR